MGWKPTDFRAICPRCGSYLEADQPTGRLAPYGAALFHAECVEAIEQANAEVAQVQEATRDA